jgi:hypothetical protein
MWLKAAVVSLIAVTLAARQSNFFHRPKANRNPFASNKISDKHALVTGSTSGIGLATAKALLCQHEAAAGKKTPDNLRPGLAIFAVQTQHAQ